MLKYLHHKILLLDLLLGSWDPQTCVLDGKKYAGWLAAGIFIPACNYIIWVCNPLHPSSSPAATPLHGGRRRLPGGGRIGGRAPRGCPGSPGPARPAGGPVGQRSLARRSGLQNLEEEIKGQAANSEFHPSLEDPLACKGLL